MLENTWWAEKYRPKSIDEYASQPDVINYIRECISKKEINHLLFHNEKSGSGKTTLAKIIAKELEADTMYINASDENNLETVRDKIKSFASSVSFSKYKIIILDEFSYFTPNAQSALNSMMETFSKTTRFILTCNYVEKILPSIRSRCTQFHLKSPNIKDVASRCKYILETEGIEFDNKDLAAIVKDGYPDQRMILNNLQRASISGKLIYAKEELLHENYLSEITTILASSQSDKEKFENIRKIFSENKLRVFDDFYRYLFDNVASFTPSQKAQAILILAKYQYQDPFVLDKEINATACIVELIGLK